MVKNILLFIVCFNFFFKNANAQNAEDNPKLVVGIVIDQMRWDYLYRFGNNYSNDGFKRMLNSGYSFEKEACLPFMELLVITGMSAV